MVALMTLCTLSLIIKEKNIIMPRTLHLAKELFVSLLQNFDSAWNVFPYIFTTALLFTCVVPYSA